MVASERDREHSRGIKILPTDLFSQGDEMADKKYSFKDAMRGFLVFETYREMTAELDGSVISSALKADLNLKAPISIDATIELIKPGLRWAIQNGAKKLLIYKDKEMHSAPVFRMYKEDFSLETDFLPGIEIVGTCFYRQSPIDNTGDPYKHIFPETMTGVTFRRCNLDNIYIPPGNIMIDIGWEACGHRRIRAQNDLEDWIVDATGEPIEPLDIERFQEEGKSIDPNDIPVTRLDARV